MLSIAMKFILRSKKKTLSIVLGISFSVMLMFSLIQMAESLEQSFKEFLVANANQDFKIKGLSREQKENIVSNLKGQVELTSSSGVIGIANLNEKGSLTGTILAGEEKGIATINNIKVIKGKYPEKAFEIVIEEGANNKLEKHLSIGDTINLNICDGEDNAFQQDFIITGIINDTVRQAYT